MAHSEYESIKDSKEDTTSLKSMEVYQHILNKMMDNQNEDEIKSLSK